jgi:hypothetical protein
MKLNTYCLNLLFSVFGQNTGVNENQNFNGNRPQVSGN